LALYARAADCPLYAPGPRAGKWLDLSRVTCLRHESSADARAAAAAPKHGHPRAGATHGHAPFAFDVCTVDGERE
jgi:hypothetical protein